MENYLIYIGKSAIAAGAFYLVFLLLFQNRKHFTFNRFYLPVSLLLSFIIPLITFTSVKYIEPLLVTELSGFAFLPEVSAITVQPALVFEWYHYLFGLYILGAAGFLFHLLLGHFKAIFIVKTSRVQQLFQKWVNITKKDVHPFSFFSKIVLSENTLDHPSLEMIVNHEHIHVKEKHTLDILFTEILFLAQWFNPFAWLIKDAIKNNLEYKTDDQIAKSFDPKAYQMAMLTLADKEGVAPFLTALNGSQLKNRIIMMKKKAENKYAFIKQLVVLPLLAILVMGLSNKEVKTEIIQADKKFDIVVDGKIIPYHHPALQSIDFSTGLDAYEVILALGIENKVVSNGMNIERDNKTSVLFIKTSDYVLGSNLEFDEYFSSEEKENIKTAPEKTIYAIDGELKSKEEIGNPEQYQFESVVVLSGKHAVDKYGEVVKDATVIDLKTGKPILTFSFAEEKTIKGKVTDEKGKSLPGAIIVVKDESNGVITDSTGYYQIKLENKNQTLVFVMQGFEKQEIVVGEKTEINVPLKPDTKIEEINTSPKQSPKLKAEQIKKYGSEVFYKVEEMPEFIGGENALRKWILKNTNYPEIALENGIQGKVYVTFIIDKNGKVNDPVISRGVDPSLDKEALRVANTLPAWKPGKQNGKKVNVSYTIPVDFQPTVEQIRKYSKVGLDGKPLQMNSKDKEKGLQRIKTTDLSKQPLYVVDGIPFEKIDHILPENIESISVLKDKSATSAYGEKGKNGVVLITTKTVAAKTSFANAKEMEFETQIKPNETDNNILIGQHPGAEPTLHVLDGEVVSVITKTRSSTEISYAMHNINKDPQNNLASDKDATKAFIRIQSSKDPVLFIVNGQEVDNIDNISIDEVVAFSEMKKETAVAVHGEKGKNGIVFITTKNPQPKSTDRNTIKPLYVVNGEIVESIDELAPDEIQTISVLKDKSATVKYGEKGENGVIQIFTKDYKLNTPLELRKFIVGEIRYPEKAIFGKEGIAQLFVQIDKAGEVTKVLEKSKGKTLFLDEVVVVGYKPNPAEVIVNTTYEDLSSVFSEETKRVIDRFPIINIDEFKGETVAITVKFVLQ